MEKKTQLIVGSIFMTIAIIITIVMYNSKIPDSVIENKIMSAEGINCQKNDKIFLCSIDNLNGFIEKFYNKNEIKIKEIDIYDTKEETKKYLRTLVGSKFSIKIVNKDNGKELNVIPLELKSDELTKKELKDVNDFLKQKIVQFNIGINYSGVDYIKLKDINKFEIKPNRFLTINGVSLKDTEFKLEKLNLEDSKDYINLKNLIITLIFQDSHNYNTTFDIESFNIIKDDIKLDLNEFSLKSFVEEVNKKLNSGSTIFIKNLETSMLNISDLTTDFKINNLDKESISNIEKKATSDNIIYEDIEKVINIGFDSNLNIKYNKISFNQMVVNDSNFKFNLEIKKNDFKIKEASEKLIDKDYLNYSIIMELSENDYRMIKPFLNKLSDFGTVTESRMNKNHIIKVLKKEK